MSRAEVSASGHNESEAGAGYFGLEAYGVPDRLPARGAPQGDRIKTCMKSIA